MRKWPSIHPTQSFQKARETHAQHNDPNCRGRASLALYGYHTSVQSDQRVHAKFKYELNNTIDHAVVEASALVLSTAVAMAVRPS